MNTPTHFLMTAVLRKALPQWEMTSSAVLLGSVAPDIPLYGLSLGGLFYFHRILGWSLADAAKHIFDTLYFEDPIWIGLHNFLHSPLSLLILLGVSQVVRLRSPQWGTWMRWFVLACMLHSVVDIFTHHDDGPLLFWPLNWQMRFQSPVSYWDHRHFGSEVARLELTLVIVLLCYLVGPWLYQRSRWMLGWGE